MFTKCNAFTYALSKVGLDVSRQSKKLDVGNKLELGIKIYSVVNAAMRWRHTKRNLF